jgi:hypothetical protein
MEIFVKVEKNMSKRRRISPEILKRAREKMLLEKSEKKEAKKNRKLANALRRNQDEYLRLMRERLEESIDTR